jgi:hypothetical protein
MRPCFTPWLRALLAAVLAPVVTAQIPTRWSENFESYAPGTQIATMQLNGWQHWDLVALGGESVSANQALSGAPAARSSPLRSSHLHGPPGEPLGGLLAVGLAYSGRWCKVMTGARSAPPGVGRA